jgi:hypothetical protein
MFLKFAYSSGIASGAAAAASVTLSGIRENDVLLSLVRWKVGAEAAPVAIADFVITDGAIESPTVDTDTYKLFATWRRP